MSDGSTSSEARCREMKYRSGSFGLRTLMCPNASMMPSLARIRLATASSWRSSANGSGMAGSSVVESGRRPAVMPGFRPGIHVLISLAALKKWMAGTTESPPTRSAGCPDPAMTNRRCGHHRSLCEPALRASDPAEQIGEFFLDLRSQLGARAGDHGKIRKTLERPTGIDDGAGIGRA